MRNVTGENGRALLPPFLMGEQGSPFVGFGIRLIAVSPGLIGGSDHREVIRWTPADKEVHLGLWLEILLFVGGRKAHLPQIWCLAMHGSGIVEIAGDPIGMHFLVPFFQSSGAGPRCAPSPRSYQPFIYEIARAEGNGVDALDVVALD